MWVGIHAFDIGVLQTAVTVFHISQTPENRTQQLHGEECVSKGAERVSTRVRGVCQQTCVSRRVSADGYKGWPQTEPRHPGTKSHHRLSPCSAPCYSSPSVWSCWLLRPAAKRPPSGSSSVRVCPVRLSVSLSVSSFVCFFFLISKERSPSD